MFNTYITRPTEHVPYCKEVKEIRAPTDASMQILREMEEELRSKILKGFVLKSCGVEVAVVLYQEPMYLRNTAHCRVVLNGQELEFKAHVPDYHGTKIDRAQQMGDEILKVITDKLSRELTVMAVQTSNFIQNCI